MKKVTKSDKLAKKFNKNWKKKCHKLVKKKSVQELQNSEIKVQRSKFKRQIVTNWCKKDLKM